VVFWVGKDARPGAAALAQRRAQVPLPSMLDGEVIVHRPMSGVPPTVVQKCPGCGRADRIPDLQRRSTMFGSIFAAIRESLMGLFSQKIIDVINGLFGGLQG